MNTEWKKKNEIRLCSKNDENIKHAFEDYEKNTVKNESEIAIISAGTGLSYFKGVC